MVVLGEDADSTVTLAGTGTELWAALATPRTEAALADELATRYAADPAVVARGIRSALEELLRSGAVQRAVEREV